MFNSATTLMHPIEARNHAKNGFFPTDIGSIDIILSKLIPNNDQVNILDPCCGEGEALSQFKTIYPNAKTYGIELNNQRYEVAKKILDKAYYSDVYDVNLGRNQFDLLFLNPPYGNDMSDKFSDDKTERLEHKFLNLTFPTLKANGILVYIVPKRSIDEPRMKWLLARFDNITIHNAGVDTYNQVIIIGTKLQRQRGVTLTMISSFQTQKDEIDILDSQPSIYYNVPNSNTKPKIIVKHLTNLGVADIASHYCGQWAYFNSLFTNTNNNEFKKPLHHLSDWHLALLITSGAVQGIIDNGKRKLLVKGITKKIKQNKHSEIIDQKNDSLTTIIESKDRFSAQIKAIDIDHHSPTFGQIITIR